MEAEYFGRDGGKTWHTGHFSGYVLTEVGSYDELVAFRARCLSRHQGLKPLLVIDSPDQAFYTSGHTLENFEPSGSSELSTTDYTTALSLELNDAMDGVSVDQLVGGLIPIEAQEVELVRVNTDPSMMIGEKSFCLLVPVSEQRRAFLGAPQSYFGPGPPQIFRLIEHFEDLFELELVGLGATYIYLVAAAPIVGAAASRVVEEIRRFHMPSVRTNDDTYADLLAAIDGGTHVILSFRNW